MPFKPSSSFVGSARESIAGPADWSRVQQLINEGNLNEAYSHVLLRMKDDTALIKLMGKTGVCIG